MFSIAIKIIDYTEEGVIVERLDTLERFYVDFDYIYTKRDFNTLDQIDYVDEYNLIRKIER